MSPFARSIFFIVSFSRRLAFCPGMPGTQRDTRSARIPALVTMFFMPGIAWLRPATVSVAILALINGSTIEFFGMYARRSRFRLLKTMLAVSRIAPTPMPA